MSSSNSVRWGAWAGMLGGLLWVLFPLGELPEVNSVFTSRGSLAYYGLGHLLPQLLMLMGLAALHALRKKSYGWLGKVGFFVSLAALVLVFIGGAWHMLEIASTGVGSTVSYWTSIMGFFILTWGSGLLGVAITGTPHDLSSYLGGGAARYRRAAMFPVRFLGWGCLGLWHLAWADCAVRSRLAVARVHVLVGEGCVGRTRAHMS
jgi:hypothetical protein